MDEMNLERLLDVWLTGGVTDVYGLAMKPWEAALLRSNVGAHFPSLKHQDGYKPNVKTATDFDALPYRVTDRTQYRILNKVAPSHHSDLGTIGGVGLLSLIWKYGNKPHSAVQDGRLCSNGIVCWTRRRP